MANEPIIDIKADSIKAFREMLEELVDDPFQPDLLNPGRLIVRAIVNGRPCASLKFVEHESGSCSVFPLYSNLTIGGQEKTGHLGVYFKRPHRRRDHSDEMRLHVRNQLRLVILRARFMAD